MGDDMIDQLTVFLGNQKGRLTALCDAMGRADIQMYALTVADTSDYGIVRIICDKPDAAKETLAKEGFQAAIARVVAVQVPDVPGGCAQVFDVLDQADVNVEYAYCFTSSVGAATLALKTDADVRERLEQSGFRILHPEDIYAS